MKTIEFIRNTSIDGVWVRVGQRVRLEEPTAHKLIAAKRAIEVRSKAKK